jgi:PhoD-like phosphatase
MDPVKAMGKLGLLGNALNKIDGGVEVMDDLNDHWTARNHKKERSYVIEDLQDLAADKSLRITILSGDVHLAAVGQFYANPKLGLPKHKDFRYMPNIISSAIANTPPPNLLADVLNKRNKIHHFDDNTEESMIPLFHQGVDGKPRNNKHLLPHRNWCSIRAWTPGTTPPPTPPIPGYDGAQGAPVNQKQSGGIMRRLSKSRPETSRPEVNRGRDSRPPVSNEGKFGGLMRRLSSRRRKDPEDPQRPPPPQLTRTMSLNRADFSPRNFFSRRPSKKRDDGGINGNWGGSESGEEEYYDAYDEPRSPPTPPRDGHMRLRGGGGRSSYDEFTPGDEDYFTTRPPPRAPQQRQPQKQLQQNYPQGNQQGYQDTPPEPPAPIIRPFHRTPTGLSVKQLKKGGDKFNVDLEGGLDITLNVEVNPRDPAGITVPYRLLVPRLFWDDATESAALQQPAPSGFKRFLSFKKKQGPSHGHGDGLHPHSVPPSQEQVGSGGGWDQGPGDVPDARVQGQQPPPQQQQWQQPAPPQQQHARQQSISSRALETQPRSQQHHAPQRYHQPQHSAPYPQNQATHAAPPAGRDMRYYDDDDYDSAEDEAQYQSYGRR